MEQLHERQKVSADFWVDESGNKVQSKRVTGLEKKKEQTAFEIYKGAIKLHNQLLEAKEGFLASCDQLYAEAMLEYLDQEPKKGKGNFTFYNFQQTIKIQISVSDRIDFDDLLIQACQEKLDEFLKGAVHAEEVIQDLVKSAFHTTHGKLDSKKVLNLLRYKDKVKSPIFKEALEILQKSIRKPDSRRYLRIYSKDEQGAWKMINLQFSDV